MMLEPRDRMALMLVLAIASVAAAEVRTEAGPAEVNRVRFRAVASRVVVVTIEVNGRVKRVTLEVPEGASEDEIYNAAYAAVQRETTYGGQAKESLNVALFVAVAVVGILVLRQVFPKGWANRQRPSYVCPACGGEIASRAGHCESCRIRTQSVSSATLSFDPYTILELTHTATPEEIRAAYRTVIAKYHPDKVAHLGREFQELAKSKTLEINRARDILLPSN